MLSDSIFSVDTPDLSRRNTIIPPPHIKQVIKSAEKAGNKSPVEAQVKTYEDLKSKYNKLQEEIVSSIDVKKLTSQDKTAQAKSARRTAKEGAVNNMCFLYLSLI